MQLELCSVAPDGWYRLAIVGICRRFTSGGTPSRKKPDYYGGHIPWVNTKELLGCVLTDTEEHVTEAATKASSAKPLPANTVLLAMYGATVGRLAVLGKEMVCNQACAAMLVDPMKAATGSFTIRFSLPERRFNRSRLVPHSKT